MTDSPDLYTYRANVTRVVDGDTVIADIDLGWHVWRKGERLRLARINAPELGTPAGEAASTYLACSVLNHKLSDPHTAVTVRTIKDREDPYGRMIAEVTLPDGRNASDVMLAAGHAEPWPKKTAK